MEYISSIFSLAFFLGALASLFWGSYIIRLNIKSNINRTFLFVCISLTIWSFGFAMANLANSLEHALYWRRFSALGWTSIFSSILIFLLLISNKKGENKFSKYLLFIHIPALVNMYVFAFSDKMAKVQYNLVKIDYGWTNIAVNNGWDYFYYSYYSLYMILSLVIIWKWKEESMIKQAKIVFLAMLAAAIPGGLIDLVANAFLIKPIPQMAPLFILFPVWTMYYSARYYGVMSGEKFYKKDIIVDEKDKKNIFNNLSMAFYIAGILGFVAEYMPYIDDVGSFKRALLKAITLVGVGLALRGIQHIKKENIRENLSILVLVSSIPVALLQYLNYGSITVWAFPLVIIISAIIFSKLTLLILTVVVSISTQILIWMLRPQMNVVVDKYDYILRIGMLVVAFFIGLYINKMYVAKIKENDKQIAFQKLISDITFDFLNFNQDNFDEKIGSLLEKIGNFFNVDRTYLFTINNNKDTMTYSNEWCNTGINKEVGTIKEIPVDTFPWWIDQLYKKKMVYIKDVDSMPSEARVEQEQLYRQGVKSLVSVPVMGEGKMHAFIGMDSVLRTKDWSEENIKLLSIVASILANVITPIQTDKETKFMAYNDGLTKLPNRFLFEDRVNHAISISKRNGRFIAIVFIDLDGFKSINDTIGHRGGDVLLKEIAQALLKSVGKTDIVARFGGDEFMILINSIEDYNIITEVLDKIMEVFSKPFTVYDQKLLITASAGIAVYPEDGEDSNDLLKNADIAMYKAKSQGRNQFVICTQEMKDEIQINVDLSKDLKGALERKELILYYQPQINLATKEIVGAEALLRWVHPTRGIISPGIFIPLAEKSSLINDIGEWVLRSACMQNKKWQDMGLAKITMAINVSAKQIISTTIVENIEKIFKETGINPKFIGLEITESIAIKETDYVLSVLNSIKKTGVSIAIDDFGTEYSSLSRLNLLPIDLIKIDMQFIKDMESNEKHRSITTAIINLAKSLGIKVLAEGVETAGQLEFLIQKKCDLVQGYYYFKPLSGQEMEKVLATYDGKD